MLQDCMHRRRGDEAMRGMRAQTMPCSDDALLQCDEDAGELERFDDSGPCAAGSTAGSGEPLVPEDYSDVYVAGEATCSPTARCPGRPRCDRLAGWSESVSWILKARSYHGFQPATAYLAVSYMDRFLSSRSLPDHGWALQLLSVACLSLAAKMEETSVPPLLNLQIESTRFIFEPRTIQRMELLVLLELDWRLRSLTPFAFIDLFACKADSSGRCTRSLILRACQITLNAIHETVFLSHCPASMAAAAVLQAANEMSTMSCISVVSPEVAASWCIGPSEEEIRSCYQLLHQPSALTTTARRKKRPMILSPQLRTSPSSVTSSSPSKRRRKLNDHFAEE
ncbi:cyclin-D1-1-like isoform X1 [Phragmites australis]|uniref:cyclin-D1-1-like isoform X1 n=1 Tax=Phragmites australis TaxID=29695 RepID=UPI002D773134|nr:cyclin-D1-1-like isoform X1 [Phragmites australis]